jgi:catechol 2,3-dioxygenase-like lactoylglutathione lyase family enzyme
MMKGLHHNAYRCRDSEETRTFYEDFLGLRLVSAFEINEGRALHTFFEMDDGSCLAFFEVPGTPFEFKRQDTLDLHIALGVEPLAEFRAGLVEGRSCRDGELVPATGTL